MLLNLPNILTLIRIACIPLLVLFLWMRSDLGNILAVSLFLFACLTDYFDGYFARTWKQVSPFGRFLDPIADKLLIAVVLFMLVGVDRIWGINLLPALIILSREFLVSGLREFLADFRVSVPVTHLAKWKTGIQMFALGALILDETSPFGLPAFEIGVVGLWVAAILTIITGYDYFRAGVKYFHTPDA